MIEYFCLLYLIPALISNEIIRKYNYNPKNEDEIWRPLCTIPVINIFAIIYFIYLAVENKLIIKNKEMSLMTKNILVVEEKELKIQNIDGVYLAIDKDTYEIINLSLMKEFGGISTIPAVMETRMKEYKLFKIINDGNISYKLVKTS